ncbi:MAG: hypothetical protein BGO49_06090 [Planctomycetales bacterium 71-10]|nr:MAG: hypothetical protein BGO49_06090 [Planctomycetales bacterium 71-10]
MATVAKPESTTDVEGDQLVVFEGVEWGGYNSVLKLRGARGLPKVVYLDGRLTLMSPSYIHERLKKLLGSFIEIALEGLGIRFVAAGSTTLRRRRRKGGVEGDETYYLKNLADLRGKTRIDLRVDAPPDLAVEVVVSHDADDAVEVYRRLGVPEVWVSSEERMIFLTLGEDGAYAPAAESRAVPGLTPSEVHSWITRDDFPDDFEWRRVLRRWVDEELAPRREEEIP